VFLTFAAPAPGRLSSVCCKALEWEHICQGQVKIPFTVVALQACAWCIPCQCAATAWLCSAGFPQMPPRRAPKCSHEVLRKGWRAWKFGHKEDTGSGSSGRTAVPRRCNAPMKHSLIVIVDSFWMARDVSLQVFISKGPR
jgi:hypothetical protein